MAPSSQELELPRFPGHAARTQARRRANLLRDQLLARGYAEAGLRFHASELAAAINAWRLAEPGDVLILPIHAKTAREKVIAWLDELQNEAPPAS